MAIPSPTTNAGKPIPTQKPQTARQMERSKERQIWDLLRDELPETATAAIMGNMRHESGLCEYRIESRTVEESKQISDYITQNRSRFVYDHRAYGLCEWVGIKNKERLWDFCEANGYTVDSIEGQVKFLLQDLNEHKNKCYKRMLKYEPEDLITATEDFRQSYEKSISEDRDKWCRANYAQDAFTLYCKDVADIKRIATLPFNFDIYEKVQAMNKEINNEWSEKLE